MSKNIYQMWAKYKNFYEITSIISDNRIYTSEKNMFNHEQVFKDRIKLTYLSKEILEIGFDILFLEED